MKRRYLIVASLAAASACLTLVVLALLPERPGVTKANFDRIQIGMGTQEVERILGGNAQPFHGFANQGPTLLWIGEGGSLAFIEFEAKTVKSKIWEPSRETKSDTFRRWLRLPWW